ncbi:hypothetical protein V1291_004524 [Nitrobacteraceae bacterium AZCC 1564]
MAISGDYSSPVIVNGFNCMNCTDVDYASKFIDPAHPHDGPAKPASELRSDLEQKKVTFDAQAVILGGTLADPRGAAQPWDGSAATPSTSHVDRYA